MIPKISVGYIPVEIDKKQEASFYYDAVYIEDDKYLRLGWERTAMKIGKKILTLENPNLFEDFKSQISKCDTEIYIDSGLGEDVIKGEDFAKILHSNGYKKLFLVTGRSRDELENLDFIKMIGKNCPWENKI